ncbi:hypothetical protein HNQ91_002622 [Filimonas zeae]|uniref:Membrane protein n=1 Tax=Filimonas zeae TaxID=1737353 RepID=A0A917IS96_9BACT|nr:RagB/SusD family nutrient uptake outer membrane protein [Filimonas zeae]MDR6339571.1 hypothetical protein [Filimonas zeae]GGH62993.1 membrane protein [Filimonas zeae]
MNIVYKTVGKPALVALLLATAVSCKKSFLEIEPKGVIIAQKTSDYDLLLNNTDLVIANAGNHTLMGDELASVEPRWTGASFADKKLFQWQTDIYTGGDDAAETLNPSKHLYIYNKIIGEVMSSTEGREDTKKALRAEALAGRAWVHFLWVNFFGKPYNAATAATDPAFTLILDSDVNNGPYTKVSVQAMYNQIIADLTAAIPDMASAGVYHRIRMSKAAAQGLLAKVYIFMGRFDEALPLLNESISNLALSTPGTSSGTSLMDYQTLPAGSATVAPYDQENVYAKQYSNTYTGTSNRNFWLSPATMALYGASDMRRKWFGDSLTMTNGVKMFRRNRQLSAFYGLRVPELYLLRAEVKARKEDLEGAVSDLLTLRQKRIPAADAGVPATAAAAKMPLLQFIMEERIREFSAQGYRWFDMRRLSVDPLFAGMPAYQHVVFDEAGAVKETFTLKPENFVFQISPKLLGENPGLKP